MKLLDSQNRIRQLMSLFVTQVKGATAMGRTDINSVAETILIPLFAEVYGYTSLENLNITEDTNYPAVDLGDRVARVAIQVTSTSDSEKVRSTLCKFCRYKLYEKYDRLIIYILTEKQQSYSGSGYDEILQDRLAFDKDKDILDYRDVLREVSGFQIDKARRVEEILETNFGDKQRMRQRDLCTYYIQVQNGEKVRVEVSGPWGQRELHGEFGLRAETKARIQELCERAAAAELKSPEVEELGEKLFTALFDDALRLDFLNLYRKVQREALLRIELAMDERHLPDVAALPWELIRVPPDAGCPTTWLGTAPGVGFSRRRPSWTASEPTQLRRGEPLRIALVVADIGKCKRSSGQDKDMWKSLKRIAEHQPGQIELLQPVNPATPDSVDAVLERKPHILHFIGHAQFDVDNQETVAKIALFNDTSGERVWLNPQQFGNLLKRYPPSVIMLQPCESTALSAPQAFVNVASQLVEEGIPAVVAMQYEIPNSAVQRFASAFYASLSKDEPVDKAAQEGRYSIARDFRGDSYATRDAGAPVLFTSVRDGRLFYRSFHGAPPKARKVPDAPIHLELDRTEQIGDLQRILISHPGGGIVIWGRPCAGHKEFMKIATHIMRGHSIIVLDPIDVGDLGEVPDREFFLEVLEERLDIPGSREKGYPVSNKGNRLKGITAAIQGRLKRSAIALTFFALQGTDEDTLRWLWKKVWIAHFEPLASQGLWILFFSDTLLPIFSSTGGTQRRRSRPVAVESVGLTDIFPVEVSDFYVDYLSMGRPEADARAYTMFTILKSILNRPVTPDDLYIALEASVRDLSSRGGGVWS